MSEDRHGWRKELTTHRGKCQLVGDDLFVTNVTGWPTASRTVAPFDPGQGNQSGTLTERLDAVEMGLQGRLYRRDVAPFRRDRFHIADLASPPIAADQTGSLCALRRTASTISGLRTSTNWAPGEICGQAALKALRMRRHHTFR